MPCASYSAQKCERTATLSESFAALHPIRLRYFAQAEAWAWAAERYETQCLAAPLLELAWDSGKEWQQSEKRPRQSAFGELVAARKVVAGTCSIAR